MAKPRTNIEKKMSSGGPDTPRLNMEQFIKLADADKIMKELGHIKIYSPKEYKAYQRQIKARKLSGIGSLKRSVKRVRKA